MKAILGQIFTLLMLIGLGLAPGHSGAQSRPVSDWEILDQSVQNRVEIRLNRRLFTRFIWGEPLKKPVLWPILLPDSLNVVRSWPLADQAGDRVDHPHHVGLWFNHGSVDGHDFWNNSDRIGPEHKGPFGRIVWHKLLGFRCAGPKAELKVELHWLDSQGQVLLSEVKTLQFTHQKGQIRLTHLSTLAAQTDSVVFRDNKEGMLALRLARVLEQPSTLLKPEFSDGRGGVTSEIPNPPVETGVYLNSEGQTGDVVWGQSARWVSLQGQMQGKTLTLALFDHPQNPNYPATWHARGYGLFGANNVGRQAYRSEKSAVKLVLKKGEKQVFRHQLMLAGQAIDAQKLEKAWKAFSRP